MPKSQWGLALAVAFAACGLARAASTPTIPPPTESTATIPPSPSFSIVSRIPEQGVEKPTRTPFRIGPPSPTPEFRVEGTALLYADNAEMQPIPEGYIDLDTGTVGDPVAGDLVFLVGCGTDCFPSLMVVNGAAGARMGFKAPGTPTPRLEDCAAATDFMAADFVAGIGLRLCVVTNEGRYALVWIESVGFAYPRDQLAILFQTWELPPSGGSQ